MKVNERMGCTNVIHCPGCDESTPKIDRDGELLQCSFCGITLAEITASSPRHHVGVRPLEGYDWFRVCSLPTDGQIGNRQGVWFLLDENKKALSRGYDIIGPIESGFIVSQSSDFCLLNESGDEVHEIDLTHDLLKEIAASLPKI